MFLKNWDMTRVKLITYTVQGKSINEDKDTVFRKYDGSYASFIINASNIVMSYSINAWDSKGYPSNYIGVGQFIWPGGDVNGLPARIRPSIERDVVRYEDFDLYSPFYGDTDPGSGQIYGQAHVVTDAAYNEELDQWEKTVTREFKNESGYTITVRELGFYIDEVLMAREVLETPIEVANDSYFKMSFTYKVENPHENRQVKRVKQYSRTFCRDYYNSDSQQANQSFSLVKRNEKVLLIAKWRLTSSISSYDNYYLKLNGWSGEEILKPFFTLSYSTTGFLTRIYLLSPDDSEKNLITMMNTTEKYGYYNCTYCYLKDTILDISALPIKDDEYHLSVCQEYEVNLQKTALEKHIIWLCLSESIHNTPDFYQKDLDFCDYDYNQSDSETTLLFDETDAESHTLSFSKHNYSNGYAFLKLQATTDGDIPLYEDIPVQR